MVFGDEVASLNRKRVIDKTWRLLQEVTIQKVENASCSPLSGHSKTDLFEGEFSMRRTLVLAVLGLTATSIALGQKQSASRNQRSSIEQAIRQLDNERIQAQIGANVVALDRIYADDFVGVGPSGTVRTKPQVIADFTSGNLKFQSITTDEVLVRIYENTAVETGLSTMVGQDKGKAVPRDTRFTRVWVEQQGRWRLVANHYSPRTR
jgi:ketosteroid isomerase-like protein